MKPIKVTDEEVLELAAISEHAQRMMTIWSLWYTKSADKLMAKIGEKYPVTKKHHITFDHETHLIKSMGASKNEN